MVVIMSFKNHISYSSLVAFVGGRGIWCNIETLLFHTVEPNRNIFFQTHLFFVNIYGLMWSFWTEDDVDTSESPLLLRIPLFLVMICSKYLRLHGNIPDWVYINFSLFYSEWHCHLWGTSTTHKTKSLIVDLGEWNYTLKFLLLFLTVKTIIYKL